MLFVFLGKMAKDKYVVYVYKIEFQDFEDLIHEMLEGLDGLRRPMDKKGNSKSPKGVVIVVLWISSGWTGIWW